MVDAACTSAARGARPKAHPRCVAHQREREASKGRRAAVVAIDRVGNTVCYAWLPHCTLVGGSWRFSLGPVVLMLECTSSVNQHSLDMEYLFASVPMGAVLGAMSLAHTLHVQVPADTSLKWAAPAEEEQSTDVGSLLLSTDRLDD